MSGGIDEFISDTMNIDTPSDLKRYFIEFMRRYGFTISSYHYVAQGFKRIPVEDGLRISEFPQAWVNHYLKSDYFEIDPIMSEARQSGRPFHWFEIANLRDLNQKQQAFLDDLKATGFRDGIAVPVFARPGEIAYFGLGSEDHELRLSQAELLELQAICQHMHLRYNELVEDRQAQKLSNRELQVVELIAQGKSNSAISRILGISANTVDTLVRRCFKKLGVSTRVEAALAAVGRGLILP